MDGLVVTQIKNHVLLPKKRGTYTVKFRKIKVESLSYK